MTPLEIMESIQLKKSAMVITNSAHHNEPTGLITYWNNYEERNNSLIKSRLRYSLSFRSVGYSSRLYQNMWDELKFKKKYKNLGLWNDYLVGFEDVLKVKRVFFINKTGAYYRVNVGVTNMKRDTTYWESYKNVFLVLKKDYGKYFDQLDINYINFKLSFCNFKLNPNFRNFFISINLLIQNKNNFAFNNSFTKNLFLFLPDNILIIIKKYLYPIIIKLSIHKV